MYVWEIVACRLRCDGWDVWHSTAPGGDAYHVHLRRAGFSAFVVGPTLTEAYAEAARRARGQSATAVNPPHFGLSRSASRN